MLPAPTRSDGHRSCPRQHLYPAGPGGGVFSEKFYWDYLAQGITSIIIMSCGVECPYEGAYEALAKRIDRVYALMKARGLDIRRLRLTPPSARCAPGLHEDSEAG